MNGFFLKKEDAILKGYRKINSD